MAMRGIPRIPSNAVVCHPRSQRCSGTLSDGHGHDVLDSRASLRIGSNSSIAPSMSTSATVATAWRGFDVECGLQRVWPFLWLHEIVRG